MSLQTALESIQTRAPITLEQLEAVNPEVHDVFVDGVDVGAVLVIGPEVHACIKSGFGRWMLKKQLRILADVIDRHGYATTATTTDEGEAFVERLGFDFVGIGDGVKHWRKEK
jgi:hypothetical protein